MADWRSGIKEALTGIKGEVRLGEPLSLHTTFKIGGPADIFIVAQDQSDIPQILRAAKELALSYLIIGGGSNLLISDEGFRGVVLTLGKNFQFINIANNRVEVGARTPLPLLIDWCLENFLSGIEFLAGIPAQFGGAVKSNAGAFGNSLGEVVEQVYGFDGDAKPATLTKDLLGFGYRSSKLPKGFVITSGTIKLSTDDKEAIERRVAAIREHRRKTQPLLPSAGCVFKNPRGESAGRLIEQVGLKGRCIGDAMVSEEHANFIVNRGNARFSDVLKLITEIKFRVENATGFKLEEEIIIIEGGKD